MSKFIMVIFFLATTIAACQDKQAADGYPEALIGSWKHAHEEDTEDYQVYRPADFNFPPSRGRVGFVFKADGQCTYIAIAPQDGSLSQQASWNWEEGNRLVVQVATPGTEAIIMEVLEVNKGLLMVKK